MAGDVLLNVFMEIFLEVFLDVSLDVLLNVLCCPRAAKYFVLIGTFIKIYIVQ